MNAPEKFRLTEFSHGGGCGCKIAPAILSEILASTPSRGLPRFAKQGFAQARTIGRLAAGAPRLLVT
jgi:selenide,water dikinase